MMNMSEPPPTFNLKAVVLETGIKPHTLRAWEQKYGLPCPGRTKGNHRVYTQRDIDTVKWLMTRLEEGMAISRAAELWFHLEERGEDPLSVAAYQLDERPVAAGGNNALENIVGKWVTNCLKFDKTAAESILAQAFAIYPVKMVCLEILQKGLSRVGDLWFENKATVQQEHFTSALTVKRLHALLAAVPAPTRIGRILVACPPGEEHTISLLLLSLLLSYRGWDVIYLGADVPLLQLEATIEAVKPDLVVLAAQRLQTAATLAKVTHFLQDREVSTAFGGSIFNMNPTLHERVCGYFLGDSIENAVAAIGQIMTFNPPASTAEPTPEAYEQALIQYRAKRHRIEVDTRQTFESAELSHDYLYETNFRLAQDILAGLSLGNMDYIDPELKLSLKLISNYGIPPDWQLKYFDAYSDAARKNLDSRGMPIVEWLDNAALTCQNMAV